MKEVVRLQWARGFVEVDNGGDGATRTTFVPMSNITSRSAAVAAASAVLASSAGPRRTLTADVVGNTWARPGDTLTMSLPGSTESEFVRSRLVDVDEETGVGRVTYGLSDPDDLLAERLNLAIKRLGNGAGKVAASSPSNAVPTGLPSGPAGKVFVPPWSFSPPAVGMGPTWKNDGDDLQIVAVVCTAAPVITVGSTCRVKVRVGGSEVRTVDIAGGSAGRTVLCLNTVIPAGQLVAVEIATYTGSDTNTKLVVQLLTAAARLVTKD